MVNRVHSEDDRAVDFDLVREIGDNSEKIVEDKNIVFKEHEINLINNKNFFKDI